MGRPLAGPCFFFVHYFGVWNHLLRFLPLHPASALSRSPGDPAQYKALVDAYKQSADVYQQMAKVQVERATQLFQLVVASTILPVFSAILGYIFGSKKSG